MGLPNSMVWEIRTGGDQNNGGGFHWLSIANAVYRWTASGSGTGEYFCELAAGGDPGLTQAQCCSLDGNYNLATAGTLGSLAAGEWAWGDNDALGYSTVYVRLADSADPDLMADRGVADFVQIGFAGGYDYSQQNGAVLALTDLATPGAGSTTLTSVAGGFTALMLGNIIQIRSGTGFQANYYEIVAYTNSNQVTLDRTASSSAAGSLGVGNVGGAFAHNGTQDDPFIENQLAGHRCYLGPGTHTLSQNVVVTDPGDLTNGYVILEGYHTVRGDAPTGSFRPRIDCGNYYWQSQGNLRAFYHLEFIGTAAQVLYLSGDDARVVNCKVTNTSAAASRNALYTTGQRALVLGVEASTAGSSGIAIYLFSGSRAIGCFAYDSATGYQVCGNATVYASVAASCSIGVEVQSNTANGGLVNVTCYNCGTNVENKGNTTILVNVAFDGGAIGMNVNTATWGYTMMAANCCWDTVTPFVGPTRLPLLGNLYQDPGLSDPATDDFRISLSSAAAKAGVDAGVYTGARVY